MRMLFVGCASKSYTDQQSAASSYTRCSFFFGGGGGDPCRPSAASTLPHTPTLHEFRVPDSYVCIVLFCFSLSLSPSLSLGCRKFCLGVRLTLANPVSYSLCVRSRARMSLCG